VRYPLFFGLASQVIKLFNPIVIQLVAITASAVLTVGSSSDGDDMSWVWSPGKAQGQKNTDLDRYPLTPRAQQGRMG
jgi:hypothetical protein